MSIIKLKGGSLSSTYLHDEELVRKKVSLTVNREYGYVRWYSQLKKIQRYNSLHPNLFPKILNVSYENDEAYFDLEYMKGFKDIKRIFSGAELSISRLEKINEALWTAFDELHSTKYESNSGAPYLYFKEEVLQKLKDACVDPKFDEFFKQGSFYINGEKVFGIENYLSQLESFFKGLNLISEVTIHGNPTLENTLYSFDENRIVFVDPYEESIIDTRFLDYAQVLQCSRSHYGIINDNAVDVSGNKVVNSTSIPINFMNFNVLFDGQIAENRTKEIMDVLEATQFIRMLPFKCLAGDLDKAKYFYVHACLLLSKVFK